MKKVLNRFLGSPLSLILLVAAALSLTAAWRKSEAALEAPQIGAYDWVLHPNTLLVVYPADDCGCGLTSTDWVTQGVEHQLDVLIASEAKQPEWDLLQKRFPQRVSIATGVSKNIIQRFSPRKRVGAAWIKNGRIVHQIDGVPTSNFFSEGGEK